MSFLDELEPVLQPEVVPATSVAKTPPQAEIDIVQQEKQMLLQDSASVLAGAINFAELEEGEQECPQEWIDEMGEKEAQKHFRQVKAGWRSAKDAPVGVKVAAQVYTGILKAETAQLKPKLSVSVINLTVADPVSYPRQELKNE